MSNIKARDPRTCSACGRVSTYYIFVDNGLGVSVCLCSQCVGEVINDMITRFVSPPGGGPVRG